MTAPGCKLGPTANLKRWANALSVVDKERRSLHSDLVDNTFFCAPGVWALWRCENCQSAYLDPRPTFDSIGRAYRSYYTHASVSSKVNRASVNPIQNVVRRLLEGYAQLRYYSVEQTINRICFIAAHAIPWLRNASDRHFRNLPPKKDNNNKLLDVGCGDGEYLLLAKSCGWNVCGLEPDPKAGEFSTG